MSDTRNQMDRFEARDLDGDVLGRIAKVQHDGMEVKGELKSVRFHNAQAEGKYAGKFNVDLVVGRVDFTVWSDHSVDVDRPASK